MLINYKVKNAYMAYLEVHKKIRPIILSMQEGKESGCEEAAIELLKTLERELATLEYRGEISSCLNRFIYEMLRQRAFKLGYLGLSESGN
jgi:hypothetical protein